MGDGHCTLAPKTNVLAHNKPTYNDHAAVDAMILLRHHKKYMDKPIDAAAVKGHQNSE